MLDKTVFALRDKRIVFFCGDCCLLDRIDWIAAHSVKIVSYRGPGQLKLMLDHRLCLIANKALACFWVNISHVQPRVVLAMMLPFRELRRLVEAWNVVTLAKILHIFWVLQVLVVVDLHRRLRFGNPTRCAKVTRILIGGFEDEHAHGTFWIYEVLSLRILPIKPALRSLYDRAAIVYGNGILCLKSPELLILIDIWKKHNLAWIIYHINLFGGAMRNQLRSTFDALVLIVKVSRLVLGWLRLHISSKRFLFVHSVIVVLQVGRISCVPSVPWVDSSRSLVAAVKALTHSSKGGRLLLHAPQLTHLLIVNSAAYLWV